MKTFSSTVKGWLVTERRDFTIELSRVVKRAQHPTGTNFSHGVHSRALILFPVSPGEKKRGRKRKGEREREREGDRAGNRVIKFVAHLHPQTLRRGAVCPMFTDRRKRQTNNRCALFFAHPICFNFATNEKLAQLFSITHLI